MVWPDLRCAPVVDLGNRHPLDESRYIQGKCKLVHKRRCIRALSETKRTEPAAATLRPASLASNATSRADIARPDTRASHRATHMTILGSPEPHCARAHGHAIHVLLLPAQAWPSRQTPDSRPREGAHTLRTHTAPIGRRRSRHPPYPTPRSRRSRRRWPRRGHSRQARHASVRSMKTTYSEETLHRSAFFRNRNLARFFFRPAGGRGNAFPTLPHAPPCIPDVRNTFLVKLLSRP